MRHAHENTLMTAGSCHRSLTPETIRETIGRIGLVAAGDTIVCEPLAGGVSSDIWRVTVGSTHYCLKRALPRLKVSQIWEAPIERNRFEWQWFQTAGGICGDAVPKLVANDPDAGLFVMEYLDPERYPAWKAQLRDGRVHQATARAVAERLVRIHAATAGDEDIAHRFATDQGFYAIRLEPYLVATGRVHRDLADHLDRLAKTTASTKRALVHGDVSPKNILVGPRGPVFIDAECAWYGDPAFDPAFCLNHLLLKCLWRPQHAKAFLAAFDRFAATYLDGVSWEPRAGIEARIADLLPALLLGRIDGKSPIEYMTSVEDKNRVRGFARPFIMHACDRLDELRGAWANEMVRS